MIKPIFNTYVSEPKKSVLSPIIVFTSDTDETNDYNYLRDVEVEVAVEALSELFKRVGIYNLETENPND